jgi:hypothetical protein
MMQRLWLAAPLALLLFGGAAAAEDYTLKLRDLHYHPASQTCRAKFFLESIDGNLPVGFTVTYASEQDGEMIQRCTYTEMQYRDPDWTCHHSFLTDCDGVGAIAVEAAACLDNLRNPTTCTMKVADDGMMVDKRKH